MFAKIPQWMLLLLVFISGSFFKPIIENFSTVVFSDAVYDEKPAVYHCLPISSARVVVRGDENQVLEVNPTTFFNETSIMIDNTTENSISDFRITIIPFGNINEHPVPVYSSVSTSSIAYADTIKTSFDSDKISIQMDVFPKNTQIEIRNILNEPVSYYVEMSSPEERFQLQLNPECDEADGPLFIPVMVKQEFTEFCIQDADGTSFSCNTPTAEIEISDLAKTQEFVTFEILLDRTDGRENEYEAMSQSPPIYMGPKATDE